MFYHENVLGTSLELCVRADGPESARRAEHRVLTEIDRLAAIFSGYDSTSEFSRWQAAPGDPAAGFARAVRGSPGERPLENPERRGL